MKKIRFCILFFLFFIRVLAQPGKDGPLTVTASTQIVNQYSPLSASISAGSNTLSLASTSVISLCDGDLIMVYQAQGAAINTTNAAIYGDITGYNSAGLYEFKYVQSVAGNVITTQTTFTNSYSLSGKPQVIKVPQYTTLTVNPGSSIIPKPWKDTLIGGVGYRFGGIVVVHASNIVNNGTITAASAGFRGGGLQNVAAMGATLYVSTVAQNGGEKGESIFGYQPEYDLNGGRYGRGAPANGGGGGNAHNAGGGGGGNGDNLNTWTGKGIMIVDPNNPLAAWALDPDYIANGNALTNSSGGGKGGYSFADANSNALLFGPGNAAWGGDFRANVGGFGGRPLTNINAETRIYFGGGGGTANANNAATLPGGTGGGIVYLIATTGVAGTGVISADGGAGGTTFSCSCDGASGAGAGGSVVIKSGATALTQTVTATGGKGGDQLSILPLVGVTYASTPNESDGPGGGGGGGFAAISTGPATPVVNGGANGSSLSPGVTEFPFNGSTQGAAGQTGSVSASFVTYVPTYTLLSNSPVCSGATINFTNLPVAATYTWSGPNGFASAIQNPSIVNSTTLMSGVYTIAATYSSGCVQILTNTISVTVNPTPTLSVSNSTICSGTSGSLIASGASTYTWNPGALIGNSVSITPLATTVYTVRGRSAAGCTATATKTVVVPSTMTLSIAASASSVCVGSSITLTASTVGGNPAYSYTWTGGPLTSIYTSTRVAGLYTYTVTGKDATNCFTSKTITLNFVAPPVLSAPAITICPGTIGTLTASGATSYTWNAGNVVTNPFTVTPVAASVYTVTGSAAGCTANATTSISLLPTASLAFNTASITCASLGSATVTASGGGSGPYSYSWTPTAQTSSIASNLSPGVYTLSVFDAGTGCTAASTTTFTSLIPFTGTLNAMSSVPCNGVSTASADIVLAGGSGNQGYLWSSPTGTLSTPTATGLGAGVHTIVVTDAVTFCAVTQTFLITQPLSLTVNVLPSTTVECVNTNVVLAGTSIGGTSPYTYSWTGGSNTFIYPTTQSAGGTYIYTLNVNDANNCQASSTMAVQFVDYPVLSVNSATICKGTVATLTVSGAQSYMWYPGGFSGNIINIAVTANTTYSVIGKTLGCATTQTTSILVNTPPVPVINTSSNVCEGSTINLNAAGSGTFSWSGPNNFSSSSQNTLVAPASLVHTGNYSLTLTGLNGCSAITSTFISVLTNPIVSASGASVCIGEAASINATGGQTYIWAGPNNFNSGQQTAYIPVVDNNSAGPYTVLITGNNGCSTSTVVQVVGYNYPVPTPSITGAKKICLNSQIELQGLGGGTYLWSGPNNFISHNQYIDFQAGNLSMGGVYTLTVRNESNCAASSTINLSVYPLPTGMVSGNRDKTCVPLCVDFSFTQGNNIAPIVKTNLVVRNLYSSDSIYRFCIPVGGNHLVTAFFTDTNGCVGTSTLGLTAFEQPSADFEFYPPTPVENIDMVQFSNTSLGSNITKWQWYFNQNGGPESHFKSPSMMYDRSGTFPVAMVATNIWGCADTVVKSIVVQEDFSLFVPDAFSPNGDGKNDIFQPKGIGIASYQLQIFDRWGEKMFQSSDFTKGWDGTFKGNLCKIDIYVWKIDATSHSGKTKNLSGHVTIIE